MYEVLNRKSFVSSWTEYLLFGMLDLSERYSISNLKDTMIAKKLILYVKKDLNEFSYHEAQNLIVLIKFILIRVKLIEIETVTRYTSNIYLKLI